METEKKDIGQKVSFYGMITDDRNFIHKILIPKIQRDYAQGRDECVSVRKRFLSSIFNVIDNDNGEELLLDFIFGNKVNHQQNIFEPVDGQQRLTTLFLLHLYIGKRAGIPTNELSKFSYETRDSSKQFCVRLNEIKSENFKNIKQYIQDQWWFTGLWKTDPTIKSMINMLDDIDRHYINLNYSENDFKEVWGRLKDRVVFWRLYLSDLAATDDLYIKMNSRGLPLTEFEHFKAMLEEYTNTMGELSRKIDTTWTELLWAYRDTSRDRDPELYMNNGLDVCFYNLLLFYLNVEGTKSGATSYSALETDILTLADKVLGADMSKAQQTMSRLSYILDFFSKKDPTTNELVNNPKDFFNKYILTDYETWPGEPDNLPKVFIKESRSNDLLMEVCKTSKGLQNKTVLYTEAFFQYAFLSESNSQNCPSETEFLNRFRIIRNLVENTELHASEFRENLLVIDEIISSGTLEIPDIRDEFNKSQKEQEKVKEAWVQSNPDKEALLKKLENHWLLMGNLNMVINKETGIDLEAVDRFGKLFHNNCDYLQIQRALLTIGDYSHRIQKIKLYGGGGWHRWREFTQSHINETTPKVLQEFLKNYTKYDELDNIVEKYLENTTVFPWEYYLIKYNSISNAPNAKYRHLGGKYTYLKLNANGGGGKELTWNPYNAALEALLKQDGLEAIADSSGKQLIVNGNINIDIREDSVFIWISEEDIVPYKIHQNSTGIDTVDRILFAREKYYEYTGNSTLEEWKSERINMLDGETNLSDTLNKGLQTN